MNRKGVSKLSITVLFLFSNISKALAIVDPGEGGGGGTYGGSTNIGGISIKLPSLRYDLRNEEGVIALVTDLLNYAIGFSVVVAVIMIIYGGYTFIMSGGDSENISKGGKIITAAVVGMVIVFLARLIITFILNEFLL